MNMRRVSLGSLALVMSLLCVACTSDPSSHTQNTTFKPESQNRIIRGQKIDISKEFVAQVPYKSIFGSGERRVGLVPGEYVAVFKDSGGIYYQGPGRCVYQYVVGQQRGQVSRGGLYVPNSGSTEYPIVYWHIDIGDSVEVAIAADGLPASALSSTPGLANHPYIQSQSINGPSAVGAGIGAGIVGGITAGGISFIPLPEEHRALMKDLMRYVTYR